MNTAEKTAQKLVEVAMSIVPRKGCGLTHMDLSTLVHLKAQSPQRVGALQRKIDVLPAQMSRILKKLEKLGLIERHIGDDDMRCFDIVLTAQGITHIEDETRRLAAYLVAPLSEVGKDDLQGSIATLEHVQQAVDQNGRPAS